MMPEFLGSKNPQNYSPSFIKRLHLIKRFQSTQDFQNIMM
jgi:hypothetical protein